MNFSTKEKAIISDKQIKGRIRLDEELLLPKPNAAPSESEQLCNAKCSEYAFSESEDEKSADTEAKVILVSKDHGTFEDEDSEEAFEEFDLDEYELAPWEGLEVCSDCFECDCVEICHRGRERK